MRTALPEPVRDTSPNVRLVYAALDAAEDPLTSDDLVERTGVSRRGLDHALSTLRDRGLAESRTDPEDRLTCQRECSHAVVVESEQDIRADVARYCRRSNSTHQR